MVTFRSLNLKREKKVSDYCAVCGFPLDLCVCGVYNIEDAQPCQKCNGKGWITDIQTGIPIRCHNCQGTGKHLLSTKKHRKIE